MNVTDTPEFQNSHNDIFEKIQEIATIATAGDFIYRGEPKNYEKVSSSLWRECNLRIGLENFDIRSIQEQMLEVVNDYTHEKVKFEILTHLQHYGGHTNLIDFTTDSHIALFFACDRLPDTEARIILLERTEEIDKEYEIEKPGNPQNRIIAQKSIFVQPPKGYIEQEHFTEINIPELLKKPILDHLQKHHGISTQTVYNDLHGYIKNQDTHQSAFIELYQSRTKQREDFLQQDPS